MAVLLENKVVLVTGASSGIGRETARVIASHGAKVVVAARRESELAETVSQIESDGGPVTFFETATVFSFSLHWYCTPECISMVCKT